MTYRKVLVALGPVLFALAFLLPVSREVAATIGAILWMGAWWIGEVVPLAVTALLPLVIAPLFGVASAKEIAPTYAKSPIFLFLGGFILAIALEKYDLHRYLSGKLLKVFGNSEIGVFLGVSLSAYFLSMWISNTSATLIMIPLILSLGAGSLTTALALGAAYSASIGGMATLIGTPPNILYAGVLKSYGASVSFFEWMGFAFPFSVLLEAIFIALAVLWFKLGRRRIDLRTEEVELTPRGKVVLVLFLITAVLWLWRSDLNFGAFKVPGWSTLLHLKGVDDATVAMTSAILLFVVGLVDWKDTEKVPWDALLLFGGGFALSTMIVKSKLADLLVSSMGGITVHPMVFVLIWALVTKVLTEVASNTSVAAMLLPIGFAFAKSVGMDATALAAVIAISASEAFMLPVATPPNMLVYSFKLVSMRDMMRIGIVMNVIAYVLTVLLVYRLAP